MMTAAHRSFPCPACGKVLNACTAIQEPSTGDISICWGCAEILIFDSELRLEVASEDHPARSNDQVILARYQIQTQVWKRR